MNKSKFELKLEIVWVVLEEQKLLRHVIILIFLFGVWFFLREANGNRREATEVKFFDRDLIAGAGLAIATNLVVFVLAVGKSSLTSSILDLLAVFMTLAGGTLGLICVAKIFVLESKNWKWMHIAVTNGVLAIGMLVFVW